MARDLLVSTPVQSIRRAQWADRSAWLAWGVLIATISILILAGSDHSVVSTYRDASHQWFAGRDIYTDTGHGFLYFPLAAVLFAPFAWLPPAACEIAWRFVGTGAFALGLRQLGRLADGPKSPGTFALLTLASLPPALPCARNGQSTLIMAGLMMFSCVDLVEGRRSRAVLWATLAVAFKPLAMVMLLLAPFVDRRLIGRVATGLILVLCLPFLTQRPDYVVDQYAKCGQMFRASSHCGMIELWAQPFSVLGLLGVNVPESTQTALRIAAAGVAIGLCLFVRRRCGLARSVEYLLAISVLYILFFNPRTENNTYAMLGPVIGLSLLAALASGRRGGEVVFLSASSILLAVSDPLVRLFSPEGDHVWLNPGVALLFSLYLVHRFWFREGGRLKRLPAAVNKTVGGARRGPHAVPRQSAAGVR